MGERTKWAEELAASLDQLSEDYGRLRAASEGTSLEAGARETDPKISRAAATAVATEALKKIVLTLNDMPEFAGKFANGPMADLIAALEDLRRGKRSPFFTLWPKQNLPATHLVMLKLRAVTSVHVASRGGMIQAEALKFVAKSFSDAGHRGKKGGRLNTSTIFDWHTEILPDLDGGTEQRLLAETLAKLPLQIPTAKAKALIKAEASRRL